MRAGAWLVFTFAHTALFAQLLQIRAYGTNDGLPQSEVVSVYQDRAGYMWFGTFENGVARYDGRFFMRPALPDSIVNCAVHEIYQDRRGATWIGTDEGLIRLQYDVATGDTTIRVFTTSTGLPNNYVTSILEDSLGVLWIGTRGGVGCLAETTFVKKITPAGVPNNFVYALALAKDGSVWAGTQDGVNIWRNDRIETITTADGLANNRVRALLCDRDGVMWIGTAAGLTRAQNRQLRTFAEKDGLRDTNITAIAQDQHGLLWIGSTEGLSRFDPLTFSETQPSASANNKAANGFSKHETFRRIGRRQGLSIGRVAALGVDYENNLWIGTWGGGVYKLFGNYLENYSSSNGLPAATVYGFLEDRRGRIWIGTNGGGLAIVDGDSLIVRDTRHGFPHDVVRALEREPSGAVWIGTDQGVIRMPSEDLIDNFKTWQVYTKRNVLPDDRINDLYCAPNGEVWLATNNAGALCYSNGKFSTLNVERGLPSNVVNAVHLDRQARLWIATTEGLFLRDGETTKVFRRNDAGLPAANIYCIFEDQKGRLWFGTRRGGVALYENEKFYVLNSANGLSNDVVYFINEDRQQRLWFGTNYGVDCFDAATLVEFLHRRHETNHQADSLKKIEPYFHLTAVHGLPDNECNTRAAWCDRRGYLWFGTASGATKLHPDRLPFVTPAPRVHIQSIEADGRFYSFRNDLQLKAKNSIIFRFRTLSFINEKYTRAQYYLKGFENDWLNATDDGQVRYTNLAPAKYNFHLRGANALGVASTEAMQLRFEILPPFYRQLWFIITSLFLIAGLIYGGHRWRMLHIHKRNAELEHLIEEKTHTLIETNDFLANIKDSLPVGLLVVDDKRFVVEANQTAAELFGCQVNDLHGQEIHNLLAGETMTRDMLWAALREEKRAKPSSNGHLERVTNQSGIEVDGLRRGGKKFPCRVHACNVEDDRGALRYVILTCEDISERRQLEQDLVENQKQLALLDLLAGMGDILNNKLAGIQGYLDLLKNALTVGVARREDSGQITTVNPVEVINWAHGSAGEMNTILRQLIEFGTYIAKVQAVPLDLRDVLQALARRWNKILSVKLSEMPAPIWVSAVPKIKAGLDEAIRNSREADATEVVFNLEKLADQARIRLILTDNGRGISPELVSKVFLPFFKTKATAHPGLGLWKLRQLVQQSGGSVEINFVPKGGTQLVVTLPEATPEQISKQIDELSKSARD
jgi:PAS domain S-box-containing protein